MPIFRRRKPALSTEQRRALSLLAGSPGGVTEAMMLAHGVTASVLRDLVSAGLATMQPEKTRCAARIIQVVRVLITDAGRQAKH